MESPAVDGVAALANAGVAPPAVAREASPAVAGVASPAIAGVASPSGVGVASLANLAGGVTVGVASLADAGVASLADTGVAPLADLAGSVAGGVMCLAERSGVVSNGATFLRECDVRSRSIFGDAVCWDGEADCFVCEAPSAWCHDMVGVRDDYVCEYVNYVGLDPDCIDRTG